MARAVLERQLITARRPSVKFERATCEDDSAIRRLLRENPTPGEITLSFEREPDYFAEQKCWAAGFYHRAVSDACLPINTLLPAKEWDSQASAAKDWQTIVARDGSRVVCVGSCAIRRRFVNGRSCQVGYLGSLRLDAHYAGRFDILRRGYEYFRQLQEAAPAEFYFTSIAADNGRARKFLERGLPGMPKYELLGEFITLLIRIPRAGGRRREESPAASCPTLASELITFLNDRNRGFQFAPQWTEHELGAMKSLGLTLDSFCIVREGDGIIACAAVWDQRSFKQTVIRGYSRKLAFARPALNLAAQVMGAPRLPPVGATLPHAFGSLLAVAPDRPEALPRLINALMANAAEKRVEFLTLGLAANDPRLATIRAYFRGQEYRSRLYLVRWPEFGGSARQLDGGILAPEVAWL